MNAAHRWTSLRCIGIFVAVFATLQLGMLKTEGTAIERMLIDRATVGVAAAFTAVVFPHDQVRAEGSSLVSSRVRLNVLHGCEGTDLLFLVIAGTLAFPASWRSRLLALAGGAVLAYSLNQLRILALYYTIRDARDCFELMHAYLAPTVLIVAIALFFWAWTLHDRRRLLPSQHTG